MAFKEKLDTGGGDTIKFTKIGDSITGVYLGSKLNEEGKFGPVMIHNFKTTDGMKAAFSKPNSQLTNLLSGEEGNTLKVTFAESKPSGKGNPQKIYKVAIDDSVARLDPEYLLQADSDDSDYSDEAPVKAAVKPSREEILARLGKRK